MSCHAPNDRLLPGNGPLDKSIEVYYCELEFGHKGPHKCSGHPIWWEDAPHSHTTVEAEDLSTRALLNLLVEGQHEILRTLNEMGES